MSTFWQILTAIAPVLAVLVSLVLTIVVKVIWNHEKRIRANEKSQTRHGRTIYGDDEDVTQDGLAENVRDLQKEDE